MIIPDPKFSISSPALGNIT